MLLGYGARNCWCFKDWMQVDLSLGESVPTDISMNLPASVAMGFKGANASGKTNGLKVFAFICDFAKNGFAYPPEALIAFDTFFANTNSAEFYVEFLQNNTYYRYELEATKKSVIKESLFRKKDEEGSRETEIFRREENHITKNTLYKGHGDILFRNNASFISTLHQYNIPEIKDIYDFFSLTRINVTYFGLNDRINKEQFYFAKAYFEHQENLQFTTKKLCQFDTGISDIKIESIKNEKNEIFYYPVFFHATEDKKNLPLRYDVESSGTQTLFCQLNSYYETLSQGGILVLDEFDINLHPDILPELLKLFIVKENNPKNAQLLFTSHNTDIMDLLGKYRTCIFEKENNESFCYRLDEPEVKNLRNDRPISVPYKRHLIGGYPKIGSTEKEC